MSLEIYHPPSPLAEYVQMMWHWENYTSPHTKERILPVGRMELTFNLSGGDFSIDERLVSPTSAIVVGCQSEYFVIDTSCPTTLLSVLFKSGVALDVFGLSAKELHNQIISLQDLWQVEADCLYNQLMATQTVQRRFQLLEDALVSRLNWSHERHYAVNYALDVLTKPTSRLSIGDLQSEVALSPPRFIQVFRDEIGLTPKLFSRLQRFHRLLDEISTTYPDNWADLALCLGYYDQSHLINEFRKFAGISPSEYAPFSREHNKNIPYLEKS